MTISPETIKAVAEAVRGAFPGSPSIWDVMAAEVANVAITAFLQGSEMCVLLQAINNYMGTESNIAKAELRIALAPFVEKTK